uniref:hypothetical protein n=1 Tax=Herbidospora sakaeratensis TaxID=564415 RepID=UPI0007834790|nr:hypothetical protein [Herbidospora sakaeratensis]
MSAESPTGISSTALPDGTTWVRLNPDAAHERHFTRQPIDVSDTRILRTLLRDATGKPASGGYAHRGVVTLGARGAASLGREKDTINGWLWTNAQGVPHQPPRLGSPLVVTVPPADQVIDERDW